MSAIGEGLGAYALLILAGVLPTQVWRWMGMLVGNRLPVDGAVFQWVRLVAAALVAAMVSRMLLYPAGTLAAVPWAWRFGAFLAGVACYFFARRSVPVGITGGALVMLVVELVRH